MTYATLCSGIEAVSVAAEPLGWRAAWFSEIDPFCNALLTIRWPGVPNVGDMTAVRESDLERCDVLVAGTPCQSFSVAGLRGGLADARGNLALRFFQIAGVVRPRWIVWENVPGCLSSNGGRDFGAILGALGELGYGFAYRVLDAQFVRVDGYGRAVPQRRRRVFVVGCLGDWRRAAAVLFDSESLYGNSPPRRTAGEGIARDTAPSIGASGRGFSRAGETRRQDPLIFDAPEVSPAMKSRDSKGVSSDGDGDGLPLVVAHSLRADGHDASEDGTGRGVPLVIRGTIASGRSAEKGGPGGPGVTGDGSSYTMTKDEVHAVAYRSNVRRLMPVECEKLQGFPPGYTAIQYRGKPAADAPRYKALGNSMAVNVVRWILQRIRP